MPQEWLGRARFNPSIVSPAIKLPEFGNIALALNATQRANEGQLVTIEQTRPAPNPCNHRKDKAPSRFPTGALLIGFGRTAKSNDLAAPPSANYISTVAATSTNSGNQCLVTHTAPHRHARPQVRLAPGLPPGNQIPHEFSGRYVVQYA